MRIFLTPEEATAVIEALRWSVYHIENSQHTDEGKQARIAHAKKIERSVRAKIRATKKEQG
jgi:hypothetical protein